MFLILRIIKCVKEFIRRIKHPVNFDLCEEYRDIFDKREALEKKNLLVGTVRRKEQLQINLDSKFYHIPLEELVDEKDLEYVALYQSKSLFDSSSCGTGIHYYGKIINTARVKRSEIPEIPSDNSQKLYVRFDVDGWKRISSPIKVGRTFPRVFLKTSIYLFENARSVNDLMFNSVEEYVINLGIYDLLNDVYDSFSIKDFHASRFFNTLTFKSRYGYLTVTVKDFKTNTAETLNRIFEII